MHIPNTMPDYASFIAQLHSSQSDSSYSKEEHTTTFKSSSSCHKLQRETKAWLLEKIDFITCQFPPGSQSSPISREGKSKREPSIYVGCGGNAYLHWKLARFFELEEEEKGKVSFHCKNAVTAIEVALGLLPKRFRDGDEIAFYIGSAGIYSLAAVIFSMSGHLSRTEEYLRKLLSLLPSSLSEAAADEILYGRAGYLFCLLFVQKHVSKELCGRMGVEEAARQVFDALMDSGKRNSGIKDPDTGVLGYLFHGHDFHGAAHGHSGILYILLQFPSWCQEPSNLPWITATLDAILDSQFPSGNFPASFEGSKSDKLMHWCHGAPGVVYTLYHAHKVLGRDKTILRSLDQALGSIWERGILRKGFGLCHGTAGSAYAFLMMYRYTGAEEHLYRAHKMAEAIRSKETKREVGVFLDSQRYSVGIPDFPYSLMEGLGGTICFCCDLLHPESAAFPGYEGDI